MPNATGTFEVTLLPLAPDDPLAEQVVGRMSIDKQFRGDIDGTSKGQMLAAMSSVKGSAAYVAIEKVSGSLNGKTGTFVLYHTGVMNRGDGQLSVNVMPDSGTGQLAGLAGRMTIDISGGKHAYTLDYTLDGAP